MIQVLETPDGTTVMTCFKQRPLGDSEIAAREVPSLDDDEFWREWLKRWMPK